MSSSFQAADALPVGPAPFVRRRFTVDEFERMAETGILTPGDHVELIDGEIIAMNPIGVPHAACLSRTETIIRRLLDPAEYLVRGQSPVRLAADSAPQPDLAVVTRRADFYSQAHPSPTDIHLLIEIADSSVNYDLRIKTSIYARSAIAEYWIVDLVHDVIEVRRGPVGGEYTEVSTLRRGDIVTSSIPALSGIVADDLLG
jgi:Uma2 family endonuclease